MLESAFIALIAPLVGGVVVGLGCRRWTRVQAQNIAIAGMGISVLAGLSLAYYYFTNGASAEFQLYHWANLGSIYFEVGFLIDHLSVAMTLVVSIVSLLVHIYTIGYMYDEPDPSYNRFFSYISLFTFAMLSLVLANNFLQLFFGWEGVGLMSYLLIGFWFKRQSAVKANLKAFLINRVGDFGFLLGIALVAHACDSLNYSTVFATTDRILTEADFNLWGWEISLVTAICMLLFVGAMGKSAQVPLHAWLPDSMEGPTPISALIHAATMVTAGIYMVARMSPLFELSEVTLEFVMTIGVITAFTMGLIGLVQNDVKRVVAYSTLSQLGYMTAALGISAYHLAFFHLTTHAFFKALLFLAMGSVIVAMHHEQDMRKMGGLRRKMPITYSCTLVGILALIGFPAFSGFFSKDLIIEFAYIRADDWFSYSRYLLLLLGVFVTALYSFRLLFIVFHGEARYDTRRAKDIHETGWSMTAPLILLAIPSSLLGWSAVDWFLANPDFAGALSVLTPHRVDASEYGSIQMLRHAIFSPVFGLTVLGGVVAWLLFGRPGVDPSKLKRVFAWPIAALENKYGFDVVYMKWIPSWSIKAANACWRYCDQRLIDEIFVRGAARLVGWGSRVLRLWQSGRLYDYLMTIVFALVLLLFVTLF